MNDVVIFTAADASYFRMCLGLVLSLLRSAPMRPRIRILDLGLTTVQRQTLTSMAIVEVGGGPGVEIPFSPA